MNQREPESTKHLAKRIVESFELDLAYDEEAQPSRRKNGSADHDDFQVPPIPTCLEGTTAELQGDQIFDYFLRLKDIRVRDGLRFDKARESCANSHGNDGDLKRLIEAARTREQRLEAITWRCSAAINRLLMHYAAAREDEQRMRQWATMLALYHSELCASASPDVSYGHARHFHDIVPDHATCYHLFEWIARHNVARGQSHAGQPLEAVKTLDQNIDDLEKDLDGRLKCDVEKLRAGMDRTNGDAKRLLRRLLYFPAVLTLTQALEDLGRHAERRYYLKKAITVAAKDHASYWEEFIRLKRILADLDISRTLSASDSSFLGKEERIPSFPPRTLELRYIVMAERERDQCPWKYKKDRWLFHWHAAEPETCCRRLQGIAKALKGAIRDRSLKEVIKKEVRGALTKMWKDLNKTPQRLGGTLGCKYNHLRFLCEKSDEIPSLRHRRMLWKTGEALYEALTAAAAGDRTSFLERYAWKDRELEEWAAVLSNLMKNDELFTQFHSQAEMANLFPERFAGKTLRCPAVPSKNSFDSLAGMLLGSPAPCGRYGCTHALLHLSDSGLRTGASDLENPPASLDYCFSSMATQQERFLEYLKSRTGREKWFNKGEPRRRSAAFEFISLRRWNSFSPNLGSRAAATVGGGYFVRIWAEVRKAETVNDKTEPPNAKKRYVGIAVDPGYDFLENFFNEGFTIPDVDLIVVTHAHPDHTENLTNFFTLLREREKRVGRSAKEDFGLTIPSEHRILLAVTEGVFERYHSHFRSEMEYIKDIVVLRAEGSRGSEAGQQELAIEVDETGCQMELGAGNSDAAICLEVKSALHDDATDHDSIGIVLAWRGRGKGGGEKNEGKTRDGKNREVRLGILSDTRFFEGLSSNFRDCDVVIAHIGGLLDEDTYKYYNRPPEGIDIKKWRDHLSLGCAQECRRRFGEKCARTQLFNLLGRKGHLYLPGLMRLLCELSSKFERRLPLTVISEFGEELRGGLRADLARRLSHFPRLMERPRRTSSKGALPVVPCDVGLRIDVLNRKIFCDICHRYVDFNEIHFSAMRPYEEPMAYVCNDCRRLRSDELSELLDEWFRTARPVVPL